ncbi:MAG: hypothetical protein JXA42_00015 [Anaerolineales bacterium]|nr:hypothetical protein [Anaerolineales bacterium]
MDDLIQYSDGGSFATGVIGYSIGQQDEVYAGRLCIEVSIGGKRTIAAIDTGGFYVICDPKLGKIISPSLIDPLGDSTLEIRGTKYKGKLYRLAVELLAKEGNNLEVDSTVFIPEMHPEEEWNLPSFLGFQGFLERIRFAVNPDQSLFYFGGLGEG